MGTTWVSNHLFETGHLCPGTGENGSWKNIPDPSGVDQKRRSEALRTRPRYIDHVWMKILTVDGKKARGELDQIVLGHTLRNIFYRIPKGRQPCDDVSNS
ncbi:jg15168 [Pararge aegeria aegeria]|uniref:Jg15168 protein n=1 Tax=Pararge aegeria aegeria TaxID=348720 RepID=A0A8S4SM10_9NEOP|nr:jg15168 [Pararge aegeria aegeria]